MQTALGRFARRCISMQLACAAIVATAAPLLADARGCNCDTGNIAEMEKHRECSLCVIAEKQPPYVEVFFLKDANPTKPNRILALPRVHTPGSHPLSSLSPEIRLVLWSAAITKAREVWGDAWAIAYNGEERRTQCHAHLHIGKLLPDQEDNNFIVVNGPAEIPAPKDGTGLWVHPVGDKLHVHLGRQVNESVLMR